MIDIDKLTIIKERLSKEQQRKVYGKIVCCILFTDDFILYKKNNDYTAVINIREEFYNVKFDKDYFSDSFDSGDMMVDLRERLLSLKRIEVSEAI